MITTDWVDFLFWSLNVCDHEFKHFGLLVEGIRFVQMIICFHLWGIITRGSTMPKFKKIIEVEWFQKKVVQN